MECVVCKLDFHPTHVYMYHEGPSKDIIVAILTQVDREDLVFCLDCLENIESKCNKKSAYTLQILQNRQDVLIRDRLVRNEMKSLFFKILGWLI